MITSCPTCGKNNVRTRAGRNGGTYLVNVEVYPNGAAYPRGAHTAAACAVYAANRTAEADRYAAVEARNEACRTHGTALLDARQAVVDQHGVDSDEFRAHIQIDIVTWAAAHPELAEA